jgi:hypothetical protein
MSDLEEYQVLHDEEARRAAFVRFIKRQKVCSIDSRLCLSKLTGHIGKTQGSI